jgi:hypothetical protein
MRRWLARLSYSFIIIAAVLLWQASKLPVAEHGRQNLYYLGALICIVLGAIGVRARHRLDDENRGN